MSDGLAGLAQGAARGAAQLPEMVQADRNRIAQQQQFDASLNLQKEDQQIRKDAAAAEEKHRLLADKVSLLANSMKEGPNGELVIDQSTPERQKVAADLRASLAGASDAEARSAALPGALKTKQATDEAALITEQAKAEEAKANAKYAGRRADLTIRGIESTVKGQELENAARFKNLKTMDFDKRLDAMSKFADIGAKNAQTAAIKAGVESEKAKLKMAQSEETYRRAQDAINRAVDLYKWDTNTRQEMEKFAASARAGVDKNRSDLYAQLLSGIAAEVGGNINAARPEDIQGAQKLVDSIAPEYSQYSSLMTRAVADHPEAADTVRGFVQQMQGFMGTVPMGGVTPDDEKAIRSMMEGQLSILDALAGKAQRVVNPAAAPPAAPAGQGGPVVGLSDGTKVVPPPAPEKTYTLDTPRTSAGKNLTRLRAEGDTRKFLTEALTRSTNKAWAQQALNKVVGVATPEDAVTELNRINPGHWTLGPNKEIIEFPWGDKLPTNEIGPKEWESTINRLSKDYLKYFANLKDQEGSGITASSDPADPAVVRKVVEYYGPLWAAFAPKGFR